MKKLLLILCLCLSVIAPAIARPDCQQQALAAASGYYFGCREQGGTPAACSQQAHTVYCNEYASCAPTEPPPQGCQQQ
jgi:hypothetical protein